jgi:D-aminoacyl-tRNA deacylase
MATRSSTAAGSVPGCWATEDDVRALVQRVTSAAVSIDGVTTGRIGPGLCVLVGVTHEDTEETADRLAEKVWRLRVFPGADGAERSVAEGSGELLVISQFTLYGDTRKGRRPSWTAAACPERAEPLVARVVERLRTAGATVATGRFGADMAVELVNDGPFTLMLEV